MAPRNSCKPTVYQKWHTLGLAPELKRYPIWYFRHMCGRFAYDFIPRPSVQRLSLKLEAELTCKVTANCLLSPPHDFLSQLSPLGDVSA